MYMNQTCLMVFRLLKHVITHAYLWWIVGIWMNWGLWPYGQIMGESPCGDRIVGTWVMVIMALEDGKLA